MQTVEQFKIEAVERFTNQENFAYFGDLEAPPWGVLGFVGQHRDSDALDRSNFQVITEDLLKRFPDSFQIERSSNWLVGWSENVRIDTSDDAAVVAAMDWQYDLDQYPVADEEHYSNLECEDDEEYYQNGGREDALAEIEGLEQFAHLFDEHGELLPEFEEYINMAFHDAMDEGDHTAIPSGSLLPALDNALYEKQIQDRIEYERYQPPLTEERR